jgi:hypothetical protein
MRNVTTTFDDKTLRQMQDLAEHWGLPEVRHINAVVSMCVERVWQQEIGEEGEEKRPISKLRVDNN